MSRNEIVIYIKLTVSLASNPIMPLEIETTNIHNGISTTPTLLRITENVWGAGVGGLGPLWNQSFNTLLENELTMYIKLTTAALAENLVRLTHAHI